MRPAGSGSPSTSPRPTSARIRLTTTTRRPARSPSSAGRRLSASTSPWSETLAGRATETVAVNLSNPANATIGNVHALGTILDDDAQPALSIGDASVTE